MIYWVIGILCFLNGLLVLHDLFKEPVRWYDWLLFPLRFSLSVYIVWDMVFHPDATGRRL